MYGRDLGQKTFLENVYDDVVKTFFKHFALYIKMFDKCFVNIVAVSPSFDQLCSETFLSILITMINLLCNG